jgi:peptidoglycan/LPS O-acetylase OafA/YrhL
MGSGRNHLLDGMRGCAALLVLFFHLGSNFHAQSVPGGYLAVDFFFILSGFVVTKAYGERLRGAWSLARFVQARVVRLYPLYLFGGVLGVAVTLAVLAAGLRVPFTPTGGRLATDAALNLLLLPDPFKGPVMFPFNPPGWSLSLELAINLLFGAALFRAPKAVLWLVALAGAALMTVGAIRHGSLDAGVTRPTYYIGVGRTLWGFTLGILLARYGLGERRRVAPILAAALMAALAAAMLTALHGRQRTAFDLAAAFVGFPAVVAVAANREVGRRALWLCALLGDLSFALYATHYPLVYPLRLLCHWLRLQVGPSIALSAVACIGFALLMARIDAMVRRRISRALNASPAAAPQTM